MTKICTRCGAGHERKGSHCNPCRAETLRERRASDPEFAAALREKERAWHQAGKERRNALQLERYHRRRAEVVARLGGACVRCGSVERLEFDHVQWGDKSFDISPNLLLLAAADEIGKLQLLCKPCHDTKTRVDRADMMRIRRADRPA